MPDGEVNYPLGDVHYYGHGHPSIAAFIQQYTDPERTEQDKAIDLATLRTIEAKDRWRELPRDYYIGKAILPFVINSPYA